jgi:hypothetical protein
LVAFAAIASTLPKGYTAVGRPNGQGGYLVTLDPHALNLQRRDPAAGEGVSGEGLAVTQGRPAAPFGRGRAPAAHTAASGPDKPAMRALALYE